MSGLLQLDPLRILALALGVPQKLVQALDDASDRPNQQGGGRSGAPAARFLAFAQAMDGLRAPGGGRSGCEITTPAKERAYRLSSSLRGPTRSRFWSGRAAGRTAPTS
jgi:hypothetical protein